MSDETARALQDALAAVTQVREETDKLKHECLDQVADHLPAKLDALAKSSAHDEPEVTKGLGREGIERFRSELAEEAAALAADIRGAANEITWPAPGEYSFVDKNSIHNAIYKYMRGSRLEKLIAVFKRHGYSTRVVHPQSLYDSGGFTSVAAGLNTLGEAEKRVDQAKADDDRSTVDSIWGE